MAKDVKLEDLRASLRSFSGLCCEVTYFPSTHGGHQNLHVSPAASSSLWLVEFWDTKEVGSVLPESGGMGQRWQKPQHA